jgi:hypothetical protein
MEYVKPEIIWLKNSPGSFLMFFRQILVILLIFVAVGAAYSQYPLAPIRQELPLPVNDSGGKWITSYIDVQSVSAYPTHLVVHDDITSFNHWKVADSAYYLMDSITLQYAHKFIQSNKPWQYIDSTPDYSVTMWFLIPPHTTLRMPIYLKAISQAAPPKDTSSIFFIWSSYNDSSGTRSYYDVSATLRCPAMFTGEFGGWQTTLPANDSGGRWLRSGIDFKSISPYNLRLDVSGGDPYGHTFQFDDDSVFAIVDSLHIEFGSFSKTTTEVQKYRDSTKIYTSTLYLTLKPHQTIHLPVSIQYIGFNMNDTTHFTLDIFSRGPQDKILPYGFLVAMKCLTACSAPSVAYNGTLLTNKNNPVNVTDATSHVQLGPNPLCSDCPVGSSTKAAYKIVGEYSDRFDLPVDTLIRFRSYINADSNGDKIIFHGAPKSLVHDTLVATFSTCLSSVTTRTPIEAYSIDSNGYKIRSLPYDLVIPFLGASGLTRVAVIVNTSNFPITLRDLRSSGFDSMDFEVYGPSLVAAHDSAYIEVRFKDKNITADTLLPQHESMILGIIAPYQQELAFADSAFSFFTYGRVNVYSPKYFSFIPLLETGIHPAGIIFTSSVSSLLGPATFVTVYSNNDQVTQYFDVPYYDDSHFKIDIGNYIADGTAVFLPGNVVPDTVRPWQRIQAKTTFSGDSYHNYYTQLHWPREKDTITIDVVCIGSNAPTFLDVTGAEPSTGLRLWPNPASDVVRLDLDEPAAVWIVDELGRVLKKTTVLPESPVVDLRNLPEGFYTIAIPSKHTVSKIQLIR